MITTPTGHTYTTRPGIALIFPDLNVTTPALPSTADPPSPSRANMMPRRKRKRTQVKAARIEAERPLNAQGDPPPF